MKVYHAVKSEAAYQAIVKEKALLPGRNVSDSRAMVHISLDPFEPGSHTLDAVGATTEAWILELEIPDDTVLEEDPSGEGKWYGQEWKVYTDGDLPVHILQAEHIPDVRAWERGEHNSEAERARRGELTSKQVIKLFPEDGWSKLR